MFGQLLEEQMRLSPIGEIVEHIWSTLPPRFPNVQLDEHIIMTDHLHGILIIGEASTGPSPQPDIEKPRTLGWMLGQFKGAASYLIHKHLPEFRWQHNFYEHIIRNDEDLDNIRRYIRENPSRHWHKSQQQS